MARSRTTWAKGSGIPAGGEGWGGPARGASTSRYSAESPADQDAAAEGRRRQVVEAQTLREMLRPHLSVAAQTWLDVLMDPDAPHAAKIAAAEKIAERVEGKVTDKLAILDTRSAEELSDDELAAIARRGRAEAAASPPDQD